MHSIRCGLLLNMCRDLSVCLLVTRVNRAKTAETIQVPLDCGLVEAKRTMYSVGVQIAHGKGHLWGVILRPVTCLLLPQTRRQGGAYAPPPPQISKM